MNPFLVLGIAYAVCAAITMVFVTREIRHGDGRLGERWNDVEFIVGRPLMILSVVLYWPIAAWTLRNGSLPADKD